MSQYEIEKKLGEGAFGTVHLYRRRETNQMMAQKEIKLAALSKDEISRLLDEVKVLEKFRDIPHRNLVEGKGYMHMDDILCIYMEYCEKGPLDKDIKSRQTESRFYDETTVLDYTQQIAAGLDHMHRHLVIHRDLKPANILITRDGVIKLADFGLGALLNSEFSMRATCVGTPLYMAPEIINDEKYKFSCDIWAFGAILYELMALQPAFMARNQPAVMMKIVSGNFNPLDNSYSEPLKGLVKLMLVVDPSKRPDASSIVALKFLSDRKVNASSMGELETLLSMKVKERERKEEEEKLRQQREVEEKKRVDEEERKRREEVEQQRRKEDELRRREEEITEKLRQLHVREAEENKRRQEGEQTRLEVERQWRDESERKRREEIERTRVEEAERKRREEVLRMRQEEIERQRVEEAERKRRDEVQRMRREEVERQRREEVDRKLREEAARKLREEELNRREEEKDCMAFIKEYEANTTSGWGSALHRASYEGRTEVVTLLIHNGADVDRKDGEGWTPLHRASYNGYQTIVEGLLEAGANVNAKNNDGETPLHKASLRGHAETAEVLIKAGANINVKTNKDWAGRLPAGSTPLHVASYRSQTEVVRVLLRNKADRNMKDNYGRMPRDVICAGEYADNGQYDAIRWLLD